MGVNEWDVHLKDEGGPGNSRNHGCDSIATCGWFSKKLGGVWLQVMMSVTPSPQTNLLPLLRQMATKPLALPVSSTWLLQPKGLGQREAVYQPSPDLQACFAG